MTQNKPSYWLLILVSGLLVAALAMGGCSAPAPLPSPAPTSAPTAAPATASPSIQPTAAPAPSAAASPVKPTEWRVLTTFTRGSSSWAIQGQWLDDVAKRTNGALKFSVYTQQELGYGGAQLPDVAGRGLVQMSHMNTAWITGQYPISAGTTLPFLLAESDIKNVLPVAGTFTKNFYESKYNILFLMPWYGITHLTTTKRAQHPADLKGMKIRAATPTIAEVLKSMGAIPASTDFSEIYTALQTGVINGNSQVISVIVDNKFYEVCKYVSICNTSATEFGFMVNKDAFNSLPKDVQTTFLKTSDEYQLLLQKDYMLKNDQIEFLKTKGVTIDTWNPEDMAIIRQAAAPVWDKWVTTAGPGAKDLLDSIKKAMTK
jgi:TRAP-type transport system periplasmic protein